MAFFFVAFVPLESFKADIIQVIVESARDQA